MTQKRGAGYSGLDSTRPTQQQESDKANLGGTAPGGTVAFMGAASQWSSSNPAVDANTPPGAAAVMHVGLADEAPDGSGNVAIHPGIMPGKFRTAADANPEAPDGEAPRSPDGRNRGESPEIEKNPSGGYRP